MRLDRAQRLIQTRTQAAEADPLSLFESTLDSNGIDSAAVDETTSRFGANAPSQ